MSCAQLGLSTYYLTCLKNEVLHLLEQEIISKSKDHPRYSYRRTTDVVRQIGESTAERCRPSRPGKVWSWDFVAGITRSVYRLRLLTLIDEYSRHCLAIRPEWSIGANDVIEVVTDAMKKYGQPEHLKSDNGPEFIAYAIKHWLADFMSKPFTSPLDLHGNKLISRVFMIISGMKVWIGSCVKV